MTAIKYSVGNNGMNRRLDTAFIQLLLNQTLKDKNWHKPLTVDGICKGMTISAIRNYQSIILKFMHADGLIEPHRATFKSLIKSLPKDSITSHWNTAVNKFQPIGIISIGGREKTTKPLPEQLIKFPDAPPSPSRPGYSFPLDFIPTHDYHKGGHARYFGAPRSGSNRLHAGCDLLAPIGSPVYAMEDGTISVAPYYFYDGTYAIEISHNNKIFRYGELLPNATINSQLKFLPNLKSGGKVNKGDVIGYVGKLINYKHSMLHIEIYSGTAKGPLTNKSSPNLYKRRSDILDPTKILDGAKSFIPKEHDKIDENLIINAISYSAKIRSTKTY